MQRISFLTNVNTVKYLYELVDEDFVSMSKLIDNNFIGNKHIKVKRYDGAVKVIGHTNGGQCINCAVIFDISQAQLNKILTQNDNVAEREPYREVYQQTLKRVKDWLEVNKIIF
jgi:hypothetical protein